MCVCVDVRRKTRGWPRILTRSLPAPKSIWRRPISTRWWFWSSAPPKILQTSTMSTRTMPPSAPSSLDPWLRRQSHTNRTQPCKMYILSILSFTSINLSHVSYNMAQWRVQQPISGNLLPHWWTFQLSTLSNPSSPYPNPFLVIIERSTIYYLHAIFAISQVQQREQW